jgi:endonuclease/exonuclease/phosphatase family metal-dependent hydrolase
MNRVFARAARRLLVVAAICTASIVRAGPVELTVMTQNLYFGTDLGPVAAAQTPGELIAAVTGAYGNVVASDPVSRIARVADEIAAAKPHVVALQEAVLWRTRTPSAILGPPGPEVVAFDFIQMLLADLGPTYALAIAAQGLDAAAPGVLGVLSDIRFTDRIAILVRTDLPAEQFQLIGTGSASYGAFVPIPIAGTTVNSVRNYAYVDIGLPNGPVRVVTTHLEPDIAPVQVAQGNELIAALGAAPGRQIVLGDFNSAADGLGTPTYSNMLAAGFIDAWQEKGAGDGFTCCQDANLANVPSALDQRIDLLFRRGGIETLSVDVFGDALANRTPSGLWLSDHAGVVATFLVVPEPGGLILLGLGLAGLALTRRVGRIERGVGVLRHARRQGTARDRNGAISARRSSGIESAR